MSNILVRVFRESSGSVAAEYAMILAIVGSALALGAATLAGAIVTALHNVGVALL